MISPTFDTVRQAAQALQATLTDRQSIGGAAPGGHRIELFHGANSICSQKVRAVLAELDQPYESVSLKLFQGETYLPAYVRMRMVGCDELGIDLVTAHLGSTAVTGGGCDPAVVPTLVDWDAGRVLVDSKRICIYLDEQVGSPLRPAHLREDIDHHLDLIDHLPNYQMLVGRRVDGGSQPTAHVASGAQFSLSKVARCDRYMAEHADDPQLVQAYAAKRAKELNAAETLFSEEAMQQAFMKAEAGCQALEDALRARTTQWLLSNEPTMADLFWGVELLRMDNVGASSFWADGRRPHVERYLAQLKQLPSLRTSVIDWPGALY